VNIEIKNLNKFFNKFKALDNISFTINEGEVFGILGLNGAGKTTLLRCLVNFYSFNKGAIFFNGRPLTESVVHSYFGYLPEDFQPPAHINALELLTFLSRPLPSALSPAACLEMVGLVEAKNKKIATYSRGMIQRLGLAIALLKDPAVLVLDEPILGLDVLGQKQIFTLLNTLHSKGKTIILSTHIFPHIELFCSRVGIVHHGKLAFAGEIPELKTKHGVSYLEDAFLKEVEGA